MRECVVASARVREKKNNLTLKQGLRIAVNRELHVLEKALPQAVALLRPGKYTYYIHTYIHTYTGR